MTGGTNDTMAGKPLEIWTLAESAEGKVNPVSFEVLGRAVKLADECAAAHVAMGRVTAVLTGPPLQEEELLELIRHGADAVLFYEDARFASFAVENEAAVLEEAVRREKPDVFLAAATTRGRTLMPYLAVKLGAGLTADCTELAIEPGTGHLLQTRPAVGGNILATILTPDARPQMATVRPHSIKVPASDASRTGPIRTVKPAEENFRSPVRFVGSEPLDGGERAVVGAEKIVSGGRGMKGEEGFKRLGELAELLGAAVGASREAVDRGWISYPHQIGLSGKTVSPELYFAFGISGSVQHLAGMQTSRHIIAVNKDLDAQIVKVADLAVVGDVHEILPGLIRELSKRRAPV